MSVNLRAAAADYLAGRRARGYRLECHDSLIAGFLAGLEARSGTAIGVVDAVEFARDTPSTSRRRPAQRLQVIRGLAVYVHALDAYLVVRATTPAAPTGTLLVGSRGGRLNPSTARALFRSVVNDCKLEPRPGCAAPRSHDFRHSFAVDSLIDAHRQGVDVDARIAVLAAYLGHVDPANTYWYLTASPELMTIVAERMSAHQRRVRP